MPSERALADKAVRAIVAIPIFADLAAWSLPPADRPEPAGVVAFDSVDDRLLEAAFEDDDFLSMVRVQSTLLWPALTREPARG